MFLLLLKIELLSITYPNCSRVLMLLLLRMEIFISKQIHERALTRGSIGLMMVVMQPWLLYTLDFILHKSIRRLRRKDSTWLLSEKCRYCGRHRHPNLAIAVEKYSSVKRPVKIFAIATFAIITTKYSGLKTFTIFLQTSWFLARTTLFKND